MDELELLGMDQDGSKIYYYNGTVVRKPLLPPRYVEVDLKVKKMWLQYFEELYQKLPKRIEALAVSIVSHGNDKELVDKLNGG
jgi:hypothetical protein